MINIFFLSFIHFCYISPFGLTDTRLCPRHLFIVIQLHFQQSAECGSHSPTSGLKIIYFLLRVRTFISSALSMYPKRKIFKFESRVDDKRLILYTTVILVSIRFGIRVRIIGYQCPNSKIPKFEVRHLIITIKLHWNYTVDRIVGRRDRQEMFPYRDG